MKPQRQFVTPRTPRYSYRIRPLFFGGRFPTHLRLPLRVSLLILFVLITLWLGIVSGSAWVTSHPCLLVPGGEIREVIPQPQRIAFPERGDMRMILCKGDGTISAIADYFKEDRP